MKRQWCVIPNDDKNDDGLTNQIDVVPGIEENGTLTYHGHARGPGCDCKPQIVPDLDTVIIVHRADI